MKITNSDVIKSGENELIDAISADIDWGVIEGVFGKEHKLGIEEDVEYKKGDIVVHNGQVAYELEFEVRVTLTVILDREGKYLAVKSSADIGENESEEALSDGLDDGEIEELTEDDLLDIDLEEISSDESESTETQETSAESPDVSGDEENSVETLEADGETSGGNGEDELEELQLDEIEEEDGDSLMMASHTNPEEKISQMASEAAELAGEISS